MQDAIKPALEEKKEDCVHSFITTLDLGRSCTICGLVVEHIKDMVFMWHKPVRVLNTPVTVKFCLDETSITRLGNYTCTNLHVSNGLETCRPLVKQRPKGQKKFFRNS
jgi:hypothetical protein